jgi:hypothetical protein
MRPSSILLALAVAALAVFILVVSYGLLPSLAAAQADGTFGPWAFTWLMIALIEAGALVLAWYLLTVKHPTK